MKTHVIDASSPDPFDLDSYLPHQLCINLDRRPERWRRVAARFRQQGLSRIKRFTAVDGLSVQIPSNWQGSAGAFGCLQSNLAVVRQARDERWPRVLVLEDDVVFVPDLRSQFSDYIRQVPEDWDMLFFGAMHLDSPSRVSENIGRITAATSTYCYALNESIYDAFITMNAAAVTAVDLNNLELQKRFACYCFQPHLAWVECGQSDTEGRPMNPWWIEQSLVMGGPEVHKVAARTAIIIANLDCPNGDIGKRNLTHVVTQYLELLPGAEVCVVHQHPTQQHVERDLPAEVQSIAMGDGESCDRGQCFQTALQRVDPERQYLVFADRDICPGGQVKAILMMCRTYDFVSSFAQVVELSNSASERLIADGRGVDTRGLPTRESETLCSEFCAFTRDGIDAVGGWVAGDQRQSELVRERLSMFLCPGWAPRLNTGT